MDYQLRTLYNMRKIKTLLYLVFLSVSFTTFAQKPKVMVMEIRDEIGPAMNRYVKLALENATANKADYVIVDMDSYGGAVGDAGEIVDRIMKFEKPVWVFINSDAASAGAYISIACDSIYMTTGATIGAATVVTGQGEVAPEKYQSYFRKSMRSTAEANHRNPDIAEGMVDERKVIEGIKKEGEIITFTTSEALKHGYCEAQVSSIKEILERNKIENYELTTFKLGTTEKIIAFFINPFISGLLILVIIGGIYFEMQTPGIGFPLFAAITALVLYLVPYYLNGLAEYWEIITLFIGFLLILAEVFFIPGFGVAGVLGITLTISSLILVMLKNDFFNFELVPLGDIIVAGVVSIGGICGGLVLLFVGGARLSNTRAFKSIALTDTQEKTQGYTSNFVTEISIGEKGMAHTILRPSGRVIIKDKIYDAFTRGEYIEKGEAIEVIEIEGSTLKVRKV
jgi:membrane-bound serine protease (ClpP class)